MKSFETGHFEQMDADEKITPETPNSKKESIASGIKKGAQKAVRILGLISALTAAAPSNNYAESGQDTQEHRWEEKAKQTEKKGYHWETTTMVSEGGYMYKYVLPQLNPHNLLGHLAEKNSSWDQVFIDFFTDEIKRGETVNRKTCESDIKAIVTMADKNLNKIKYPKVIGLDLKKLHEDARKILEKQIRNAGERATKHTLDAIDSVSKEESK